jgi:LPXTG-site transpeptidase (sortase) family protein
LLCLLFSYYIYAEYDKYSGEKKSQEILDSMTSTDSIANTFVYDDTTIKVEDNERIVVILEQDDSSTVIDTENLNNESSSKNTANAATQKVFTTDSGDEYYSIAKIKIPEIGLEYPILDHWSDELLKISPCKFHGADPNEVGNFCIVGHNYRNSLFFSKVPTLGIGSTITIEDNYDRTVNYIVYDKHVVDESDTKDTSQITHGKREITLITCTNDGKSRYIIKAREEGK